MKGNNSFIKTVLTGLVVVLPVAVIGATIFWLLHMLETASAWIFRAVFPPDLYFPGVGVVIGVFFIYLVGLLMNTRIAQQLFNRWENLLKRIPLVKSLYGAVQDIVQFFSSEQKHRFNKVVSLAIKDSDMRLIGFVTQENLSSIPQVMAASDTIAVYLPMSYQIGGYMVLVPRSAVASIDMSVEDASRFVFTAGMSIQKGEISPDRKNGPVVESIKNGERRSK